MSPQDNKNNGNMAENSDRHSNAVAGLYHAWITGLVLALVTRKGAHIAEEFVFRLFRQQHVEKFLPGLSKLGLDKEPHAVAAAKYHYFSNQLGGVKVEYLEENPRKAWIRYPPPRWIWSGTAICGIPGNVNRAMLRGWHAHNGVTLNNPRLGFVCTKTTVDGQPGLEGYYIEHERALAAEERLLFRPEESCPPIGPEDLPKLEVEDWPKARQAKAYRNYAMEYLRNALPVLVQMLGPEEALALGRICSLQIGMHSYDTLADAFDVNDDSVDAFMQLLAQLLIASGDQVESESASLTRTRWRLFHDVPCHPSVHAIWQSLIEGLLSVHNRFLGLEVRNLPSGSSFSVVVNGQG